MNYIELTLHKMELKAVTLKKKNIKKSAKRVSRNNEIAEFYFLMGAEQCDVDGEFETTFANKAENVKQCYRFWNLDYYRLQSVKDIKHINLCKDKFCLNCQHIIAQRRELKYMIPLDELRKNYDIYHVVITVPNCKQSELRATLDRMYAKFPYVIQYMQGKRKSNNLNFVKFGFYGAIRALEVTHKLTENGFEFHPHFHCLFVLRQGLDKKKKHTNEFSFSKGKKVREFSDDEIFLQKVWHLLYNGERLTAENYNNLKQGYSVTMDDCKGHYHQVFKYVLGGNFKKGMPLFDYEEFKTLYNALFRRKLIQGYGALNKFTFDEDIEQEDIDEIYNGIIAKLQEVEQAEPQNQSLDEVLNDIENKPNITYISRSNIRSYVKGQK